MTDEDAIEVELLEWRHSHLEEQRDELQERIVQLRAPAERERRRLREDPLMRRLLSDETMEITTLDAETRAELEPLEQRLAAIEEAIRIVGNRAFHLRLAIKEETLARDPGSAPAGDS